MPEVPTALLTDDIQARRIGAIRRDIDWLVDRWRDLLEARFKGTTRPWRQPTLTAEARAELDAQARVERHERSATAPGEHAAPVHVDVLDVLADMTTKVETLADHVATTVGRTRLPRARAMAGDARPHLILVHRHLIAATTHDPDMLDAVGDVVRELRDTAARQLGELHDGQVLAGACPFCHGRTPTHPTGGALTLQVRVVPLPNPLDRDHHEPAIVCTNDLCEPDAKHCGLRHRGRPAWPIGEWGWLSTLLSAEEAS